jgi:hypothetical protein
VVKSLLGSDKQEIIFDLLAALHSSSVWWHTLLNKKDAQGNKQQSHATNLTQHFKA